MGRVLAAGGALGGRGGEFGARPAGRQAVADTHTLCSHKVNQGRREGGLRGGREEKEREEGGNVCI